jgi:hypothetical protein
VVAAALPPPPPVDLLPEATTAGGHRCVGPSSIDSSAMRPVQHRSAVEAPSTAASVIVPISPPPAVGGLSLLDIRASSILFRSPVVSPTAAASARVKVTSTSRRKAAATGTQEHRQEASDRTERLRGAVAASVAAARVTPPPAGATVSAGQQQLLQQVQSTASAHDTTKENIMSVGNLAKPVHAASHRDAKSSTAGAAPTPFAAAPSEAPPMARKQPLGVAGAGLQSSRSHHPLNAIPSCVPPLNLSLIGQQTTMSSAAQLSAVAVPLTFGVPPPKLVPSRAQRTMPLSTS